jgi:hypothetical protein
MMSARYGPWIAIASGGLAWAVHLFAGYFLVALGCPRGWPLNAVLTLVTLVTGMTSLGVGLISGDRWWRARAGGADGAAALLYGTAALLGGLFTLAIVLSGIAALIVSACHDAAIGG